MNSEAQQAFVRISNSFDVRILRLAEREFIEKDIRLIASELSKPESCQHEIRKRVSTVGGMLECAKCGFLWKHDPVKDIALPFDPNICECCGQTKPQPK